MEPTFLKRDGGFAFVFVYRIYSLNNAGQIGFAKEIKAGDDAEAMALVRELVPQAVKSELWQDRRLVATLGDQGWTTDSD